MQIYPLAEGHKAFTRSGDNLSIQAPADGDISLSANKIKLDATSGAIFTAECVSVIRPETVGEDVTPTFNVNTDCFNLTAKNIVITGSGNVGSVTIDAPTISLVGVVENDGPANFVQTDELNGVETTYALRESKDDGFVTMFVGTRQIPEDEEDTNKVENVNGVEINTTTVDIWSRCTESLDPSHIKANGHIKISSITNEGSITGKKIDIAANKLSVACSNISLDNENTTIRSDGNIYVDSNAVEMAAYNHVDIKGSGVLLSSLDNRNSVCVTGDDLYLTKDNREFCAVVEEVDGETRLVFKAV